MMKIVFIGAGSGFGAQTVVDILSFPELHESEIVLVDVNPKHLGPVVAYSRKVVEHYGAPTRISAASDWRGGVLDGADFVITSFAQGGPAYRGVPYYYEIAVPREYGIYQNVADTTGLGGVLRAMRTAPELLAIGQDMESRCPGACLINYVNPMAMLTAVLCDACPRILTVGLCHNVQYGIRDIARWLGIPHKQLRYLAAGVNHMAWFLRLEYLDGRDAYPDLLRAAERPEVYRERAVQFDLLRHFGYFTTESSGHCAEYLPYYMHQAEERERLGLRGREVSPVADETHPRWHADSDLMQQLDGRRPLKLERSFEYGAHIIHAFGSDAVYRMNLNVMNRGMIENLPEGYCVEVPCTVDRLGIHPHHVGRLPVPLAALCRGIADVQRLAADAVLEKDLKKALQACLIDPCTAASAPPAAIRECFNKLLEAERPWLEGYWGESLRV